MDKVDKNNYKPFYHQLEDILREKIENRELKPHEKIPSENELKKNHNISRSTIRKAINSLVKSGLIYRIQGKGTYVAEPYKKNLVQGFTEKMKFYGFEPSSKILEIKKIDKPTESISKKFSLEENEKLIKIKRLRYIDKNPLLISNSYLNLSKYPSLIKGDYDGSLYNELRDRFNITLEWNEDFIEPILLSGEDAEIFKLEKGSPALLIERYTYGVDNDLIEYCESIVRGDKAKFYLKHNNTNGKKST